MSEYKNELISAMTWLGEQENTIFLGQSVSFEGTSIYETLKNIPSNKKIEMPIIEDSTIGFALGLSLMGFIPVVILPRYNFLLLAVNQIVNHLDKINKLSHGEYNGKIIIRTAIGSETPLWPGSQHVSDYTSAFRLMCQNIKIHRLDEPNHIMYSYQKAYNSEKSYILSEWADKY